MTVAVAHIMTTKVFFAAMDHTVEHARELMASKKIHALPVVGNNKKIMGIVTTTDIARRVEDNTPVRHVMSDMVIIVHAGDPVSEAARLMRKHRIHHLVVTDDGKAIGIVSSFDVLRVVEQNHI